MVVVSFVLLVESEDELSLPVPELQDINPIKRTAGAKRFFFIAYFLSLIIIILNVNQIDKYSVMEQ